MGYKQWFQMDIGKWIYSLGHWTQRVYADIQDWDKSPPPTYRPFEYVPPPQAPLSVQGLRAPQIWASRVAQPRVSAMHGPSPAAQALSMNVRDRRRSTTNNSSPVMDSPPSSPSYVDSLELY